MNKIIPKKDEEDSVNSLGALPNGPLRKKKGKLFFKRENLAKTLLGIIKGCLE